MTVRFQESAGAADQVADLIESCRKAPWENVTKIWVYANKVAGDPAVPGEIQHITKADGKVHDDPTLDVRAFLERCRAIQREKKKPMTFIFVVIGIRTANVKGRRKVDEPEEVEFFRKNVRFGDEEEEEERDGQDVSAAKVLAGVLEKAMKPLIDGKAEDRETITFYAQLAKDAARSQVEAQTQNVELTRVILNAQAEERRERREERESAMAEENETRRTLSQHARDAAFVREAREMFGMFFGMWQVSKGITPEQPPPPAGVDPSDGSIVGDLRVLLANITSEEKAQMREIMGHDLWNMILAASRASDDDGARAVLEGIVRYIKQNPGLAGNLFAAGQVIKGPRFAALVSILKRGGVPIP